ncbi:MAG: nitroreductase family deazaflavin-dependent oxidoreductase [Pseudonocardiaceae bacterium]
MKRHPPGRVARALLRSPARLYDWHCGWLLGHRFLRLTHVGRKSGRRYQTMLEVIGTGPAAGEFLVVAGLGHAADWYRNLRATPAVEIAIGRSRFRPAHRTLDVKEAIAALADYERRNRWAMPVIRRMVSWLVGWRYDGTDPARQRLGRELPIVAFRPAHEE